MNFFATLHKSVVSGEFYATVRDLPASSVAGFFLVASILSAAVCGLSHLYYAMAPVSGLAAEASAALDGIEFKNGVMDPHKPVPYVPDNAHVSRVFQLVFWLPQSAALVPDSFVVIDTNENSARKAGANTLLLLTSRRVIMNPSSPHAYAKSYAELFGPLHGTVSDDSLRRLIGRWFPFLALFYCLWAAFTNISVYFISVACIGFLALAAYIFSFNRLLRAGDFFKMAFFAASPVYIGTTIVALSGTNLPWTWQVFILISTFVMLRGAQYASRASAQGPDIQP
jgi:hypothetical protein